MLHLTFTPDQHSLLTRIAKLYRKDGYICKFDRVDWRLSIFSKDGSPIPVIEEVLTAFE